MQLVELQKTPNPDAKKFVVDSTLTVPYESVSVKSKGESDHLIADDLLDLEEIEEVYIQGSWITVTKSNESSWDNLKHDVADIIRDYSPDSSLTNQDISDKTFDDPELEHIRIVIDQEIMPFLNSHGGSLELLSYDGNVLKVRYKGACSGCPISISGTLKAIESLLQKEVNSEIDVQAV